MTMTNQKYVRQLAALQNLLADAVTDMTDEEIQTLREQRGHKTSDDVAAFDQLFHSACAEVGRRAMKEARRNLDALKQSPPMKNRLPLDSTGKRAYLRRLLSTDFGKRLSMAARNNRSHLESMSDSDIEQLLDAAASLGIELPDESGPE